MSDTSTPWQEEWEERDEIGRGGQGIVTELRHRSDPSRRAVLKRIVPRWREDQQARDRLKQEAETLAKLHDLGAKVPAVYDSFASHDTSEPFLLMEFVPGTRFDEWLKKQAPASPQKAVMVTRGISDTIALCHEHRIGHRDLKPTNIILREGSITEPYVLDFGIAFDSRQTMVLTREGEMFWNEFIMLPECQDQEGGHQDLRSDISALAGIFFSCLTGRSPIVLRNAQELAPHQRHGDLLRRAADTTEQAERLTWFFDKAFAYRIDDRFQTLEEFVVELTRFADSSTDEQIDLLEQFTILDQSVRSGDRNVQLAALRTKYNAALQNVDKDMNKEFERLKAVNAKPSVSNVRWKQLPEQERPFLEGGDHLPPRDLRAYIVGRDHFNHVAVALLTAFGVGMHVHFYMASYSAPPGQLNQPESPLDWQKLAVLDENIDGLAVEKLSVIVSGLTSQLGRQLRHLSRQANG